MFTFAVDKAFGLAVTIFSGKTNTEQDYVSFIETIEKLDSLAATREQPVFFQVFDADNPPLPAIWRKRLVEVRARIRSKPLVVVYAASRIVSTVIWAVNKLDPPPFEHAIVSSIEEGVEVVNARRPGTGKILELLYAEARGQAAK